MYNYQKKLKQIIQWISGLVLFVPILVSSEYLFPFMQLKNLVFRVLVLILVFLTVWLIIERGYIKGKNNYVLYALTGLFLISVLASWLGVNPAHSFWSNYERMDGLINFGFFLSYFFILIQVFETRTEWIWLLRASVAGAFIVAFNGVLQISGVHNNWISGGSDVRIAATIGNAAFFAAYMMFNLFFTIILAYLEQIKWQRIIYIILGLLFLSMIYYSETRGPVVGLVASIFIFSALYWFRATKKQKTILASISILIILFGGLLYSQRNSDWIKNFGIFNRIANISLQDATTIDRLLVWKLSWQSFLQKPILGYGLENYKYGFNKFYNPDIHEQWFDRSHNVIFDYLNTVGILGLLSYLTVLALVIYYFWKFRKADYILGILFIGLIVAYFVQNFFVFDTLNTYLPLLVVFGLSSYLYFENRSEENTEENIDENENSLNQIEELNIWQLPGIFKKIKPILLIVLFIAILIFDNVVVLQPAKANSTSINAFVLENKNPEQALEIYQQAIDKNTYGNREIIRQLHDFTDKTLKNDKMPVEFKKQLFAYTNQNMLAILDKDPHDTQYRLMLSALYQVYARFDNSYIKKSIELIKPALDDSPNRLQLYYVLAQGYILDDNIDEAIKLLEKTLAIIDTDRGNYTNLINVYSLQKNKEKVLEYSKIYVDKFDLSTSQKRDLVKFYYNTGLYEEAASLLVNEVIVEQPDNSENYTLLVAVFTAMKDPDSGIHILNQLIGFYPDWREVLQTYIDQLEKVKNQ